MSRIFKQLGKGYGSTPVTVVAQIDGNTVFSGPVPTVDSPVPGVDLGHQLGEMCFEWTEPMTTFQGEKSFSITVSGGTFQLGEVLAQINEANAEQYGFVYQENIGNAVFSDPLINVAIDGNSVTRPDVPELIGQWGWTLNAGSTLTATMRINTVPSEPPGPDSDLNP